MSDNECVFCKIVKGEIPANKEYEDELVFAFRDIKPVAPVHVLIVPKKHINNLVCASDEDVQVLGRIQIVASRIAEDKKIDKSFRLLTANGKAAGQSVFHLHYHLIGGWKNFSPEMEHKPGGLRE